MRSANAVRRANLQTYLERMSVQNPQVVMIGEAPGWRGCRLTGVPLTSEHILLGDTFGNAVGGPFEMTQEIPGQSREATATMVWQAIVGLEKLPLLWNAYPFHPHMPDQPWSNRTPKRSELSAGISYIQRLLPLYNLRHVIAVGRKAEQALVGAGISAYRVRHPSHGGRREFARGLLKLAVLLGLA